MPEKEKSGGIRAAAGRLGVLSFQRLFDLQFGDELFVSAPPLVSQHAPRIAEHAAETRRQMPEPARVAVAAKPRSVCQSGPTNVTQ